ncbi:XRE family transcriptional regulator [Brevibacillus gelatini]|uniref:XRE family transcriptional regulator n=1 Tax=Brevibacillus gelatini TaxID=1655277 RepID=A0A3M8B7W9_9BACL|nr:helix-turn-helix transcriptional regulator [Brevibacillus gelatini]RNB59460.1 XRE family transcriptional regulator [Brevibacillus gelatini]
MLRLMIPHDFDLEKASLRDKIQYYLRARGMKQNELALASGIHKTAMSQIMRGSRNFSIEQLSKLEEVLGLNKGELQKESLSECINKQGKMSLIKCEKLLRESLSIENNESLINEITGKILETNKNYIGIIFEIAEDKYKNNDLKQILPLYSLITSKIDNRLDERLSLSYYRTFMIRRSIMLTHNEGIKDCKKALSQLIDYLELMPERYILDAYLEVIVFLNLIEDYHGTLKYADKLVQIVNGRMNNLRQDKLDYSKLNYYHCEALLYKGFAYKGMGEFELSKKIINQYASIDSNYAKYAIGNMHLVELLSGKWNHLEQYLKTSTNSKKMNVIFPVLLEAAIKHNEHNQITKFLEENGTVLEQLENDNSAVGLKHKLKAYQYLGVYHLEKGQDHIGIEYILKALEMANLFNNETRIKKCWLIFTNNSNKATIEQLNKFNKIIQDSL